MVPPSPSAFGAQAAADAALPVPRRPVARGIGPYRLSLSRPQGAPEGGAVTMSQR
eukprot:COSAG02_NODE_48179_length_335_cov_1.309322_1_plen_54_part_10